jgi:hypothetical protein
MYSQCLIYIIFILFINDHQSIVLHIGGLFDFDHPTIDNGRQDIQAAKMAIDEINSRQRDLFHGLYTLELLANNSRVNRVEMILFSLLN